MKANPVEPEPKSDRSARRVALSFQLSALSLRLPCYRYRPLREELYLWIRSELIERAVRLKADG